ncbi:MAG: S8 family serine peptidase [Bacteroidota bacterium]
MNRTIFKYSLMLLSLAGGQISVSAQELPNDWHLLDQKKDNVPGISLEKAYELLSDRTPEPVIVAVLDSGVDIAHEDLAAHIWSNKDEKAGNKKDDDGNGYIDDINGWNFIGNVQGESLIAETLEMTRIYKQYVARFGNKDKYSIGPEEKEEYLKFLYYKEKFETEKQELQDRVDDSKEEADFLAELVPPTQKALKKEIFSRKDLEKFKARNENHQRLKATFLRILDRNQNLTAERVIERYKSSKKRMEEMTLRLKHNYSLSFDGRSLIGPTDPGYGNADVTKRAGHGTHVSGIIGAVSSNDIGIRGIASHVVIMPIRSTPMGDEDDIDVANGIRYAVDNGARIINMSFGKDYSPQKEEVDAAVRYAEEKGVLLVHGAGNDHTNTDYFYNFPTALMEDGSVVSNWIEVGATSGNLNEDLVAVFSNYGAKSVDIFAPGVAIYSTLPENEYDHRSGTSMASPVVAGVAALLLSYFPEFTPSQVKGIIEDSGVSVDLQVHKPGTQELVSFKSLSRTGKIVNAYEAVKLALERTKNK